MRIARLQEYIRKSHQENYRPYLLLAASPAVVAPLLNNQAQRDERTLMDRLISRQGLSQDEALTMVVNYRQGKRVEIDPALMEGLDAI